jgi:hypothetical protein
MNLIKHSINNHVIAEAVSDLLIIKDEQDSIRILEELFALGALKIILHKENIAQDFFDLKTGLAGAVLQKFVNYQIQVAIVGDFTNITSRSFNEFMSESNRGNHIYFCEDLELAIQKLSSNL